MERELGAMGVQVRRSLTVSSFLKDVKISTLETEHIEDNASPLNPKVIIFSKSDSFEILLVACLRKAVLMSFLEIPSPLSFIYINLFKGISFYKIKIFLSF